MLSFQVSFGDGSFVVVVFKCFPFQVSFGNGSFVVFFLKIYLVYMYKCFTYIYVCVSRVCLVSKEVRRGC